MRELPEAQAGNNDAASQKPARLDLAHQEADERHRKERPKPARQHHDPSSNSGVPQQSLQHQRYQHGASIEHETEHRHEKHAG